GDVIDAVGDRLAELLVLEVVHTDQLGLALGPPLPPGVLEIPDQLLLFGVDRDHRLTRGNRRLRRRADVLKLRVAVAVRGALTGLEVGLQAIAQQASSLATVVKCTVWPCSRS